MTKITPTRASSSPEPLSEESRVRKFAKHMLKSSLFIGTFVEHRYVASLKSYRAVIKIHDNETEFIDNLIAVRKRCTKFYRNDLWIGITDPKTIGAPAGFNLWVAQDEQIFGSYWFNVKSVVFTADEVRVKLQTVRPVTPTGNVSGADELFQSVSLREPMERFLKETLTFENLKHGLIFLVILVSTLLTFLVHATKYLLEYSLKVLHELSGFVGASTPLLTNVVKLIAGSIQGFYNLLGFVWKTKEQPKVEQVIFQISDPAVASRLALDYGNYSGGRPQFPAFKRRSGPIITPID